MGRRRRRKKRPLWIKLLLALVLIGLMHEARFFFPKQIIPPKDVQPIEISMQTTSYCHCRKCCSYHWFLVVPYQKTGFFKFRFKHVGETSSGAMVRPGSIAADTSIYPYGTVMYIPGYGYGRVEDTGGAIKGRHIDLYRPNHWFARKWGVQTKKVKVWLPAKAKSWSFVPPEKPEMTIDTMLPAETVISNAVDTILSLFTNQVPVEMQGSETNDAAEPVSTEQIPLP